MLQHYAATVRDSRAFFKRTNVQLEDISFENPQIPCEAQKFAPKCCKYAANQRFKIKSVATTSNN
jgi:hypothetical protein